MIRPFESGLWSLMGELTPYIRYRISDMTNQSLVGKMQIKISEDKDL